MNTCFLDCFSGISGDMLLGAFVDLGWKENELLELPGLIGLKDTRVSVRRIRKGGISAVKIDVKPGNNRKTCRHLGQVKDLINRSFLPKEIKGQVIRAFARLARAEAKVHGMGIDEVHFHEVGAADAIIDVTGAFVAKRSLKIDHIVCSPLPLSRGLTECEHGPIPLPAPATLELLKDKKVYFVHMEKELVTPTGALLAAELSDSWAELPHMTVKDTGYGAGTWDLRDRPNVLRAILGQGDDFHVLSDHVTELRAVVDDMNPEHIGYFLEQVLAKGAVDAWVCPVFMKKNRPGFEIHVLARPGDTETVSCFFLTHTTSTGIRVIKTRRMILPRKAVRIKTRWGTVTAKAITRPDGNQEIVPEFEQCKEVSEKFAVSIAQVYKEVICGSQQPKRDGGKK